MAHINFSIKNFKLLKFTYELNTLEIYKHTKLLFRLYNNIKIWLNEKNYPFSYIP